MSNWVLKTCLAALLLTAGSAVAIDLSPPVPEENPKLIAEAVDTVVGVRAALDRYARDHRGEYPDFRQFPEFEQLVNKTEASGVVSSRGACGPYLNDKPTNPLRKGRKVAVVPAEVSIIVDPEIGFIFDDRNRFFLVDSRGHKVDEKTTVQHPVKELPLPTIPAKLPTPSATAPAPAPAAMPATGSSQSLDGTDMQHLTASANLLAKGLPPDKQDEFDRALAILNTASMDKAQRQLCADLNGKTPAQATEMAREVARQSPSILATADNTILQRKLQVVSNLTGLVRNQLDQYRRQHRGELPNFARYPNFEQLTKKTNQAGDIVATGQLGPYLDIAPVNPMRKASRIVVTDFSGRDMVISDPAVGWILIEGRLYPLDSTGRCIPER